MAVLTTMSLNGDDSSAVPSSEVKANARPTGHQGIDNDLAITQAVDSNELDEEYAMQLLREMRVAIAESGISVEDINDTTLLRFLAARNMRVDKAATMYTAHRTWRLKFVPREPHVPEEEISRLLRSDLIHLQHVEGEVPLIVITGKHHDCFQRNLDELNKFVVYLIDKTVSCLPASHNGPPFTYKKYRVIFDMSGCGFRNMDPRGAISFLSIAQSQYPERLDRLYLIHAPFVFWGAWKAVCPFLDPITRQKFMIVDEKEIQSTLVSEISPSVLPKLYGGEAELTRLEDVHVSAWPSPTE